MPEKFNVGIMFAKHENVVHIYKQDSYREVADGEPLDENARQMRLYRVELDFYGPEICVVLAESPEAASSQASCGLSNFDVQKLIEKTAKVSLVKNFRVRGFGSRDFNLG